MAIFNYKVVFFVMIIATIGTFLFIGYTRTTEMYDTATNVNVPELSKEDSVQDEETTISLPSIIHSTYECSRGDGRPMFPCKWIDDTISTALIFAGVMTIFVILGTLLGRSNISKLHFLLFSLLTLYACTALLTYFIREVPQQIATYMLADKASKEISDFVNDPLSSGKIVIDPSVKDIPANIKIAESIHPQRTALLEYFMSGNDPKGTVYDSLVLPYEIKKAEQHGQLERLHFDSLLIDNSILVVSNTDLEHVSSLVPVIVTNTLKRQFPFTAKVDAINFKMLKESEYNSVLEDLAGKKENSIHTEMQSGISAKYENRKDVYIKYYDKLHLPLASYLEITFHEYLHALSDNANGWPQGLKEAVTDHLAEDLTNGILLYPYESGTLTGYKGERQVLDILTKKIDMDTLIGLYFNDMSKESLVTVYNSKFKSLEYDEFERNFNEIFAERDPKVNNLLRKLELNINRGY